MINHELLLSVMKPARYIGNEVNSIKKDLLKVEVEVCLCFPDTYEIGMSHHGLRILYDLINKHHDYTAERVFSPWTDMEEKLRQQKIPLFSLESRIPVKDFDILGFSLTFELSYTNVLNILSLSEIPLNAKDRTEEFPLVIAGGVCSLNPEPMADFIDVFVIGEAEDVIIELLEIYKKEKPNGRSKILKSLALVEGLYVPSVHTDKTDLVIRKRYVKDVEKILDMDCWIVPYIEIVHDRLGIEIMRGCPHACRFCQARSCFYPLRVVSEDKILETAKRLYHKTGYDEISLLSLSSSDHPAMKSLAKKMTEEFSGCGVSISLPSVRPKLLVGEFSGKSASSKRTSLTFAPEAGSERLRKVINKNIDIDELFEVARQAYKSGYRLLKLYFMIGLPSETNEDLDAIADVCRRLSWLKKQVDGHPAQLNVGISNFIPKPHTVFQWHSMNTSGQLKEKQEYLKKILKKERGFIHLKFHDAVMSSMECVLARGDRRLGSVIYEAFSRGAKFDAWDNFFNFSLWQEAFVKEGVFSEAYCEQKDLNERLNWDFIDVGIAKDYFVHEARVSLGD